MARALLPLLAALLLAACDSDSDKACQDVGNCSRGGSDDWIMHCQAQAETLGDEAHAVGCQAAFDAYFECTGDHFECTGNQSSFPGCEAKLEAYSTCLATKEAGTACVALENELATCDPADGAAKGGSPMPTPCTASGDCSARCYLDALANVCAPTAAELTAFADCASHCVF
jgi:hypothetical protein